MEFVLLPNSTPMVSLRAVFLTGSAYDPPDKPGCAWVTAWMLASGGTRSKTYPQILDAFFPLGTAVGCTIDHEMTAFTLDAHVDTIDEAYALFREMLTDPGFRADDFERLRDDAVNYLTVYLRGQNDEELGKEALLVEIFKGHPYGHPGAGAVPSLRSLTLDDVRRFYETHYSAASLAVGLGGGYAPNFPGRILEDFSVLSRSGAVVSPVAEPDAVEKNTALLIEKPARSVAISFGFPIEVRRGHEDYIALLVATSCFGQHRQSSGRLFQRMRQLRGLNYGDYAYIEHFPGGMFALERSPNLARRRQIFEVWIRPVERGHAHFSLRLALFELQRLIAEGLTEEEFRRTRSFLSKYVGIVLRTTSIRLGYEIDSHFYGIPSFPAYLREGLERLTLDDVNRAIRKHLRAGRLRIAMVGPEMETMRNALINNAPSPIGYHSAKPDDILDEDKVVAEWPVALDADAVRVIAVERAFE